MFRFNPFIRHLLSAGIGASLFSFPVLTSAHAALPDAAEDTLVVTASAVEQNLKDAPASISVIGQDDLSRKPVHNLVDVLRDVPGVQITTDDNRKLVNIRGLGGGYTLILVDGKRVSSRTAMFRNNDFDLSWIPVSTIERVEVVRGPMSSLYGADAMGGVINIITKKTGKEWSGVISGDMTLQEHRDRGDTYGGQFSAGGPLVENLLGVKVYGALSGRDKDTGKQKSADGQETTRAEGFTTRNGGVDFTLTPLENHEFSAGYSFDRQDRESEGSSDKNRMERQNYSVSHNGQWESGNSELRFYSEKVNNLNTGNTHPITSWNEVIDGKYVFPFTDYNHIVILGGDYRREKISDPVHLTGEKGSENSTSQYSLFAEDEWRLFAPLALTTGVRMDKHENYGTNWSPRAYLVWNATDSVTVKGGWARAFKAPTLIQQSEAWLTNSCKGGCQIIGSPDLKPETSESIEGGVYYSGQEGLLEGVEASVTVYRNEIDDMIANKRSKKLKEAMTLPNFVGITDDGRPIFRYFNINKARIQGLESELKIPLGEQVKLSLTYTYTDGRDLSSGEEKPLNDSPFHNANGRIDWTPLDDWSFYVSANYHGETRAQSSGTETQGGYTLWDAGASWKATKNITVRSGILNVMDKDLERNDYSYTVDGRRYFLSMDYRF
ncbi:catecholate siderophore receptor CirA [Escherichia coli]|uniref:catecholate siderophore receptor CirA n=1 Tax=Escherichia coli TaxID=562 RepID=UPI000B7DB083|nr:catecholate siderophore receptor CirA [Escherichia coli]EEU4686960.1 catecholate siderophore receptor CirA [Escherichia coli]EEV0714647.1 catecholate siderophore receptor CirA [Escherichia coli]EEV6494832.1 catecholate siderophore receptor CirA [Escherichia coli]EEV7679246.1 catecholate siderophore receptor CirA [Escherichia coli]EEW5074275.1 catecholate siderophore receptor CirA [Escherichia coli]